MESALRSCARGVKIGKLLIARTRHCGRLEELAAPSAAPSPAPVGAGAAASGRPPRLPSAQGALLPSAPATTSTRAMSLSCDDAGSPTSAPQGLVRLQSAHGPPPTAANGANGNGSGSGNALNGGNLVIYEKLPRDIAERHVLLMDPVLTTGHTATKAVETLLARGVKEERIVLLSILASPAGVARLCGAHPRLRLVTAEIDEGVDERWQLVPGMGEFGQRYYS
jgi:phosphoribosylpyrophosphate synthetase